MAENHGKVLLEVDHLTKYFNTPRGPLHAVDGVSFTIEDGEIFGLFGESAARKKSSHVPALRLVRRPFYYAYHICSISAADSIA